jgi:PAS domain S-box-containing protein
MSDDLSRPPIAPAERRLQQLTTLVNTGPTAMFVAEIGTGNIVDANTSFAGLTGGTPDDLDGRPLTTLDIWRREQQPLIARIAAGETMRGIDIPVRRHSGELCHVLLTVARVPDAAGHPALVAGVLTDITAVRKLERRLQQAQKMEAIGQLAGGVAHDFNNLLTVIGGFAELLAAHEALPAELEPDVREIQKAAASAAMLTRQLLTFGVRTRSEPRVVDLNGVVQQMTAMLRRLIGEDITFDVQLEATLKSVFVDPGQIEQVIVNLVVNARDAMPFGGQLTIETKNILLDEAWADRHRGGAPGLFVMLAVTDTGIGMDDNVQRQLFKPFFTTKEHGRGTGLGLAIVYSAVKNSGGSIWVYSEPGVGSTFKIYLPVSQESVPAELERQHKGESRGGIETIVVVEDQTDVRNFVREALQRQGYTVLDAANPRELVARLPAEALEIDLLLTDVVMPQMSGRQLARICRELYPRMRVLYMSGYTPASIVSHGILEPGRAFLQKPFSARALLDKVRTVLDARIPPQL